MPKCTFGLMFEMNFNLTIYTYIFCKIRPTLSKMIECRHIYCLKCRYQWCENRTGWTATQRHKRVGSTIWTGMMVGPEITGKPDPTAGPDRRVSIFSTKNHFEPCKDRTHALSSHSQHLYHPNCEALLAFSYQLFYLSKIDLMHLLDPKKTI